MSDIIQIRGFRVLAVCGADPHEQDTKQPFDLNMDVVIDTSEAALDDDLNKTFDYAPILDAIKSKLESSKMVLIEKMAQIIADIILEDERVQQTTVEVFKVRPPVPHSTDKIGIKITRGGNKS